MTIYREGFALSRIGYNRLMNLVSLLPTLIGLVLGLTLHEFAHALMGSYLGDNTAHREGRLSLNPAAHIDPVTTLALPLFLLLIGAPVFAAAKPVPFNPYAVRFGRWGAALVAVAGPVTNFLIAAVCAMTLRFVPHGLIAAEILGPIIVVNLSLFVFNLIPFPPLDGSRVLYAAAPEGLREIMDQIERAGIVVIFAILFIGYRFIGPVIYGIVTTLVNFLLPSSFPGL